MTEAYLPGLLSRLSEASGRIIYKQKDRFMNSKFLAFYVVSKNIKVHNIIFEK